MPNQSRSRPTNIGNDYNLDDQIGFILRKVSQRYASIFTASFGNDLTGPQWATLAKLYEIGPTSQNQLGRGVSLDAATIKGVVDRLSTRGLVSTSPDPVDARRILVILTEAGRKEAERGFPLAAAITKEALAPLDSAQQVQLVALLKKLS